MNAPRLALSALSVSLLCAAMIGCARDADEPEPQGSAQAAVHTGYGYEMIPAKVRAEAGSPAAVRPAEVPARLPPEMIRDTVRDALAAVSACNPGHAGDVTARFVIDPAGAVKSASTEKLHGIDAAAATCVRDVISGLHFPASHDGDIEVVYQLDF